MELLLAVIEATKQRRDENLSNYALWLQSKENRKQDILLSVLLTHRKVNEKNTFSEGVGLDQLEGEDSAVWLF